MPVSSPGDPLDRANRRVGWLVALGGLLAIAGQVVPDLIAQAALFPVWWNVVGATATLAIVVLATVGLWLPDRLLRTLWLALPLTTVLLQLTSYAVYRGPVEGVAPWVWRLEPAALTFLVFVTRPSIAVGATIAAGGTVALSAWIFTGAVPTVVAWNTPFHMSEIGFVVIFLGIRNRVVVLNRVEAAARLAAEQRAVRAAELKRHAHHARLVHDEVLSVLNAARMFSGDPPEVLRVEARQALRAMDVAVCETSAPVEGRIAGRAAADRMARRLSELLPSVTVAPVGEEAVPEQVVDAVLAAALEAARNALRHAQARRVSASIDCSGGAIRVLVEDDGIGFDPERTAAGRRGLSHSIHGRLTDVGGDALIDSSPGAGTRVLLSWCPPQS